METNIKAIENIIEYKFKNENLLKTAFTHSSFANIHNLQSNERLEFLGDSVLNFCTTKYLYQNLDFSEGDSSKIRAFVVSSENVSEYIKNNKLIDYLSCHNFNPKNSTNVMGDLYESIIGAMFLDSNFDTCEKFIEKSLKFSKELFNQIHLQTKDYKTELQEYVQAQENTKLEYVLLDKTGPAHLPEFTMAVEIDGKVYEPATAKSKKEAENLAAQNALKILKK